MILFVILVKTLRQHSFLFRTKYKVSFSFLPNGGGRGGQNEIVWIVRGASYISVCKACGKLGGSGGMLLWEILILDLLLDTNWSNQGLFLHKHNLPLIVSLKLL